MAKRDKTAERARNKTGFSGFTFKRIIGDKYGKERLEVDRIKYGSIKDEIKDGVILSHVLPKEYSKPVPLMFNRKNFAKVVRYHGYFNTADIVMTANEFEEGIFIKGKEGGPDKINLIKNTDKGCFVIGANRFNGFGVVTFFEHYGPFQKQQYLASMRKRGTPFQVLEGGESLIRRFHQIS